MKYYLLALCVFISSSVLCSEPDVNQDTNFSSTVQDIPATEQSDGQVSLLTEKNITVVPAEDNKITTHTAQDEPPKDVPIDSAVANETASPTEVGSELPGQESIANGNETDSKPAANKTKITKVTCRARNLTEEVVPVVRLVNSSVMLNVIVPNPNITANECALVMFYAPWCHFSARAAPHYNALARVFPSIHMLAINAIKHNSLNSRYGTVAVPTLLLFHNGRAVAKFNESQYVLDKYVKFVEKYTGLAPEGLVNVTSVDFEGPLPSEPTREMDYMLWLAWFFILSCCGFGFSKSTLCSRITESIRNNWREAEAQHEHAD